MDSANIEDRIKMPPPKWKPRAQGGNPVNKRRQSGRASSSQQSDGCSSSQDILESFAKLQRAESSKAQESDNLESPRKRQKKSSSANCEESFLKGALDVTRMYTFSKNTPNGTAVVDLTSSPDITPLKSAYGQGKTSNGFRSAKAQAHVGAKKLVVRNFRKEQKSTPDQYLDQTWLQLDSALSAIFNGEEPSSSREELYRGVENVCRQDRASALYEKLCKKCKEHMMGHLRGPLLSEMDEEGMAMLDATVRAWSTWSSQMVVVRSIFYYMDRSYLLHLSPDKTISGLAIAQFRSLLLTDRNQLSDRKVIERVVKDATDLINSVRHGNKNIKDLSLLSNAVDMFHQLYFYTEEFEPRMLARSKEFYKKWANDMLEPKRIATYVRQCQRLIKDELQRCETLDLDTSTVNQITKLLDHGLVSDHVHELVDKELLSPLLEANDRDSLHILYSLLQRKELCGKLRPAFEAYISDEGSKIVFDEEREQDMVIRLLTFKRKLDAIWEESFEKHEGLGHSLREAFEGFINKTRKSNMTWGTDNPKPGEMIAKYVDMILKGGSKAIPTANGTELRAAEDEGNEDEMDEDAHISRELDQVLDMFRFVHGKAVFEAFYKRDLARRLLMGRSASADAEKSMLTRLRSECGAGFTHNLEQMFTDIELAREEISSYKQLLEDRQTRAPVDLSVNVLSSAAWPSYPDVAIEIPINIQKATAGFEAHYKAKHGGRRLQWKHALAHCQLRGRFPKGDKEFVVSSFQAIVMLHFNDKPADQVISYTDIQAATNLPAAELNRTLQSLACARYRVLSKHPRGRDVNTTDTFTVNLAFTDPKYRIKINQIQLKETPQENKETHERVAADRHYETQAAIVRIMKGRKKMKHGDLVAEVIKATISRGVLDPVEIKKEIEKLIEKDYLEREDGGGYKYLA